LKKTCSPKRHNSYPRQIALKVLNKVEKGKLRADEAISGFFNLQPSLSYREKAFVTELVYGVLRWRGSLDWIIEQFFTSPNQRISRLIRNIIRIGVYQILYLDQIPVPVSVWTTVDLAKDYTNKRMASLVNGLLRNVERNRDKIEYPSIQKDPIKAIATRYSHPAWLVEKWLHYYGVEETISLCKANNTVPQFTVRTNTLKATRERLIEELQKEGVPCKTTLNSPEGIILDHPADITRLSSFQKGWFFVQDEAAQMISCLTNPQTGDQVLDLCAAPGGKSTHMAQMMNNQGHIVAVDVRGDKIALLQENQLRLGINIISAVLADAACGLPFLNQGRTFDKVLLDAPCSGLGILRRHPEGKWVKSSATITRLKKIQLAIIQNASIHVKSGGCLVYSTCTLNPEENEMVIEKFLSTAGNEFQVENPLPSLPSQVTSFIDSRGYFHTFPQRDSMDGFFGARLRRSI